MNTTWIYDHMEPMIFPSIRKDAHRKEAGECCHRIEDVEGEHLMNWKY